MGLIVEQMITWERIGDFKYTVTQFENQKENRELNEENFRDHLDNNSYYPIIRFPREESEWEFESVFVEIMGEKVPKLAKDMVL